MHFKNLLFILFTFGVSLSTTQAQVSVAHEWSEELLNAIRNDFARPPVHARNLYHVSAAMYDAWAAIDPVADTYFLGKTVDGFNIPFNGFTPSGDPEAAQKEAITFAAYRLIRARFQNAPGGPQIMSSTFNKLLSLGYNPSNFSLDYSTGDAGALGNYIADRILAFGRQDGSNELGGYTNRFYQPVNPPLIINVPGNSSIIDYNRWQPITLNVFIDQSGNVIPFNTPPFQSPEWGEVSPFSLKAADRTIYNRGNYNYEVYHDPGPPPMLDTSTVGSEAYKWNFELVSVWSSHLGISDTTTWDISPRSIGNIDPSTFPTTLAEYQNFYDLINGGDASIGHTLNPATGMPYAPQRVKRADYGRVLAEFWADGPDSETPPGHWFSILNYVNEHPDLVRKWNGEGPELSKLEWDVKAYFTLGGAMHDVAITAWGIKGWYDGIRPVSALRAMADLGQSSDPALPNYHQGGLRLLPGYIELVQAGDPLQGANGEHIDKIKVNAWRGPDYIVNPFVDQADIGWILAEEWWPFQRPSFVSPPFGGYISGHSTYSRAAAEVLTAISGNPFFPGGMGIFDCAKNEFLVFEEGPSEDLELQWATYRDASDQCSLSRIWGGIHPPFDDIPGRRIGIIIGNEAFEFATSYFSKDQDGDGFLAGDDCDDNDDTVYPGAPEICDGKDNNCDGAIDEGLMTRSFYADVDGDGFGNANSSIVSCEMDPPTGYVTNQQDCNDNNNNIYPGAPEIWYDGIDQNCDGLSDFDQDGDGFDSDQYGGTDCNDLDVAFGPAVAEIWYDGIDQNCDGLSDYDQDGDGFDSDQYGGTDCLDTDMNTYPAAAEIWYDGIDQNCDGLSDYDQDGDGFDSDQYGGTDCNDINVNINPSVVEIWYTGVDENCDGWSDYDQDFDGQDSEQFGGTDCDDLNPNVYLGAIEVPDGLDNNCNGLIDDISSTKDAWLAAWKMSPNPTTDQVTLQYETQSKLHIQILSLTGKSMFQASVDFPQGKHTLATATWPAGTCMVVLTHPKTGKQWTDRLVKL